MLTRDRSPFGFGKLTASTLWTGSVFCNGRVQGLGRVTLGKHTGSHQKLNSLEAHMSQTKVPLEPFLFG